MSVRDLITAIESGDSVATQQVFEAEMTARIVDRLNELRVEVAKGMFKEQKDDEQLNEMSQADRTNPVRCEPHFNRLYLKIKEQKQ